MMNKAFCEHEGKLRLDLVPPEMEEAFAQVAGFGLKKLQSKGVENAENNWLTGLKLEADHITKARRHILKWRKGVDNDDESGLNHLKHALWHLTAAVTQIERGRTDLDDRNTKKITNTYATQYCSTYGSNHASDNIQDYINDLHKRYG